MITYSDYIKFEEAKKPVLVETNKQIDVTNKYKHLV